MYLLQFQLECYQTFAGSLGNQVLISLQAQLNRNAVAFNKHTACSTTFIIKYKPIEYIAVAYPKLSVLHF